MTRARDVVAVKKIKKNKNKKIVKLTLHWKISTFKKKKNKVSLKIALSFYFTKQYTLNKIFNSRFTFIFIRREIFTSGGRGGLTVSYLYNDVDERLRLIFFLRFTKKQCSKCEIPTKLQKVAREMFRF